MLRYFCPNVLFRKREQWYPTMRIIQSWELGGNRKNIVSQICLRGKHSVVKFANFSWPDCGAARADACWDTIMATDCGSMLRTRRLLRRSLRLPKRKWAQGQAGL